MAKKIDIYILSSKLVIFTRTHWIEHVIFDNRGVSRGQSYCITEYGKGHQYITLVYQLDNHNKRLLLTPP